MKAKVGDRVRCGVIEFTVCETTKNHLYSDANLTGYCISHGDYEIIERAEAVCLDEMSDDKLSTPTVEPWAGEGDQERADSPTFGEIAAAAGADLRRDLCEQIRRDIDANPHHMINVEFKLPWQPTEQDYLECCGVFADVTGRHCKHVGPDDLTVYWAQECRTSSVWKKIEPIPEQCIPREEPPKERYVNLETTAFPTLAEFLGGF